MGVNNKQRRAAKQRKRQRSSGGPGPGPGSARAAYASAASARTDSAEAYALADFELTSAVRQLTERRHDHAELLRRAESLLRLGVTVPQRMWETVLHRLLAELADALVRGGWGTKDLQELVYRRDPGLLPLLETVGRGETVRIPSSGDLAAGLGLAALFAGAPLLDSEAVAKRATDSSADQEHPKLAQVRALLAKAESTDFDEEADALSAKAQQLITRYALDRLVAETSAGHNHSGSQPTVRRLWLDAPYVRAKAGLVDQAARANRSQTAVAEQYGFCLVVGSAADLDAVELLVTSLLVQANTAMLRRSRGSHGTSRTRSFRQSFLVAYSIRVGERLRASTEAVSTESGPQLLPVLHDHEARVSAAFAEMVPHTVGRATSISNREGWTAGLAAAEVALLDVNGKLASS